MPGVTLAAVLRTLQERLNPAALRCVGDPDLVYENIKKLATSILAVHAKTYAFDAEGNETTLDFARIMQLLKEVGYKGHYNVEFEGRGLSDFEGVTKTIQLLRKYL